VVISIVNMNWHIPPSSSSFFLSLSLCVNPQRLDALPISLDVAGVYSFRGCSNTVSRLELVLSEDDNEAARIYSGIDQLYSTILEFSFRNATTQELTAFQLIAGTLCTVKIPVDKQTL